MNGLYASLLTKILDPFLLAPKRPILPVNFFMYFQRTRVTFVVMGPHPCNELLAPSADVLPLEKMAISPPITQHPELCDPVRSLSFQIRLFPQYSSQPIPARRAISSPSLAEFTRSPFLVRISFAVSAVQACVYLLHRPFGPTISICPPFVHSAGLGPQLFPLVHALAHSGRHPRRIAMVFTNASPSPFPFFFPFNYTPFFGDFS